MSLDWTHFTPMSALSGGVLLGLAAAFFILINGRILGISGILGGLLSRAGGAKGWRLRFLLGMAAAPAVFGLLAPPGLDLRPQIDASLPLVGLAGVLVGLGTRYASGCTSGHGVCGLSRLSLRSLAATASFMGAGFVTVFVTRHLL